MMGLTFTSAHIYWTANGQHYLLLRTLCSSCSPLTFAARSSLDRSGAPSGPAIYLSLETPNSTTRPHGIRLAWPTFGHVLQSGWPIISELRKLSQPGLIDDFSEGLDHQANIKSQTLTSMSTLPPHLTWWMALLTFYLVRHLSRNSMTVNQPNLLAWISPGSPYLS